MNKAIFLDRDGIVNNLVYNPEQGVVDSPIASSQIELMFGVDQLIKGVKNLGFLVIVCSNQPSVGLGKITLNNLKKITEEINSQLKEKGLTIDDYYYCPHHPFAKLEEYKINCNCRKPNTGLFFKAADEHNIDLSESWMIGDGVDDIKAGKSAGCKTILLANINSSENLRIIEEQLGYQKPDFIVKKLPDALNIIKKTQKK